MALHTFLLQPSADIHLLPGQNVQANVIGFDDAASVVNPINSQCSFTMANTGIASVSAGGLITANSAGITFMTVVHTASGVQLVARVWSHDAMDNMFLGNNSGTVNVGTDNFQPTVFATFDAGDMEDITGHPYVTYQSLDPALFSVDNQTGRVTGITVGNGHLRIKEAASGTTIGDIPITVKEAIATARPVVERVTFKGAGADKRNILFLAEGFSAGEENKFKQIVRDLDHKMRISALHQPYKLLSNDYNTWMGFEASVESGLTVGPAPTQRTQGLLIFDRINQQPATAGHYSVFDLINLVGLPTVRQMDPAYTLAMAITEWAGVTGFVGANLEAGIFDAWQNTTKEMSEQIKAKNSVHGLIYGRRLGDIAASDTSTFHADNRWYLETSKPTTYFYKDPRRMGTTHFYRDDYVYHSTNPILPQHWTDEFFSYLNNLKRKAVPATDPQIDIGQTWNLDASDQALVVVIVNDEKHGAKCQMMPNIFAGVSAGRFPGLLESSLTIDAIPDHTPNTSRYFLTPLVSHVLHELSHGVFLGDEYDDFRNSGNNTPASAGEVEQVEIFHNNNSQNQININGLKWSKIFRVTKSSALLTQAHIDPATMAVQFDLFPGESAKWTVGEVLFMVTKNLNVEANFNFYSAYNRHRTFALGPLTVSAKAGDTVTLSGLAALPPAGVTFEKGSMICLPLIHNASPLFLTLPGVVTWMNNGTGNLPGGNPRIARFLTDKGGHCTDSTNDVLANTPHPIAGVNIAFHDRHWLIGAHEGAAGYNCGVVRPAAVCKMRQEYWYQGAHKGHFRFCHVCRYYLVQEFNASRHPVLDALYPGSPV